MKKIIYFLLLSLFAFTSCNQEDESIEANPLLEYNTKDGVKVNVCHNGNNEITISINAVETHKAHGDAVDIDDDGYYDKESSCSELIDCDDANPNIYPGATEICDGIDNNCDGNIDEGVTSTFYEDSDGDGFGNPEESQEGCSASDGWVADNTDCDDAVPEVNPGMEEICDNSIDDDCDGEIDEDCSVPAVIGDYRDGGVVFWVDPNDNTHGLVCDINDLGSAQWCSSNIDITGGADGTAIGTGAQNTIDILAECGGTGSAADLCDDSTNGGFSDWFLPSKDELNEMYLNRDEINTKSLANGGSALSNTYWSSTESPFNVAWFQFFNRGYYSADWWDKDVSEGVRAVRAF